MATTAPMGRIRSPEDPAPVSRLRVRIERRPGVFVLRLSGQLDIYTVDGLRHRLEHLDPHDHALVVDLSRVDFVDSSGLGALMFLRTAFAIAGRRLGLSGASSDVVSALEIAGMGDLVIHADSIGEACRLIQGEAAGLDAPPGRIGV